MTTTSATSVTTIPSTVPMVPFAGRMSYCLMRSLQMVLAHQGDVYPVEWLECVSGEPFGFVYIQGGRDLFGVVGYEYHKAGLHMLEALGYDHAFTSAGADDAAALVTLDAALRDGPVVAGMLDMGYLTYAPDHATLLGADHAIVILARRTDALIVHDPAGFPAATLALADFLEAWHRDIYTETPFGLWRIGARRATPAPAAILDGAIARAHEVYTRADEEIAPGITLRFGPPAMRLMAADLRAQPERPLGGLPYFNWRVSGQRCLDGAAFLRERLPAASAIRWEQCQVYGAIQQASVSAARPTLTDLLERQADLEERFIAALG